MRRGLPDAVRGSSSTRTPAGVFTGALATTATAASGAGGYPITVGTLAITSQRALSEPMSDASPFVRAAPAPWPASSTTYARQPAGARRPR